LKSYLLVFLSSVIFSSIALADCRLDAPISLNGKEILETSQNKMVSLDHVVFDKAYKTEVIPAVNEISDMEVKIFNIGWSPIAFGETSPTGYVGVGFGPSGSSESAGFSYDYGGSFQFNASSDTTDGITTYSTSVHGSSDSEKEITSAKVSIQNGSLIGVEVTVPVYHITPLNGGGYDASYTGEQETLCVNSGVLKP
jgi:hypothetical protein